MSTPPVGKADVMLPRPPRTPEETGLREALLIELILKTIYTQGQASGREITETVKLRHEIVFALLQEIRPQQYVEVRGSERGTMHEAGRIYGLTEKGRQFVQAVMERDRYVGAAPVTLPEYCEMVQLQSIRQRQVTQTMVREVLADLVIAEDTLRQLGPACNSGQSLFLYGKPGNGKTLISQRLSQLSERPIALPYAVETDNQIIKLLDPAVHQAVSVEEGGLADEEKKNYDERWQLIRRPFIVVGGELTLAQLDLTYDPELRYYAAPLQMKANGGTFLIDDFGRQRMRPEQLLNRWILPLEKRIDFFTLHTGKQIQVPFDVFLIFSTNLEPYQLVDEAFLRRIRYKIEIKDPTEEEFKEIFRRTCAARGIPYDEKMVTYLINHHYFEARRELRAVHPRDLIDQMVDLAKFENAPLVLSQDLIDAACRTYFIEA